MTFSSRSLLWSLALTAGLGSAPLLAQGKAALDNKPYRDPVLGFEIRPLHKWAPVPPRPEQRYTIASFHGAGIPDPASGYNYEMSMEILKFDHKTPVTRQSDKVEGHEETPEEKARRQLERLRENSIARTFPQYVKLAGYRQVNWIKEGKKIKLGKNTALEYEYTNQANNKLAWHNWVAVFTLEDFDLAIVYTIPDIRKSWRKWFPVLRRSAKTFKLIERVKNAASDEKKSDYEKRKHLLLQEISKFPEWRLEETPRYLVIIHNDDRDFVREIKRRIEAIRDVYEEQYPPLPGKPITAISVLRVCKDRDEYLSYSRLPGSAGYWNAGSKELVIYDDKNQNRNQTYGTLNHEAFHQYIYYRCGEISPHYWYNEGSGDYYAGYKLKGRRYKVGKFDWRLPTVKQAMRTAKNGGKGSASFVPLQKLINADRAEYYGKANLYYSLGWSLVYFLHEGTRSRGYQKSWTKILPTYLKVITETKDAKKANKAAFKGVDLKALEKAWINYKW